MNTVVQIDPDGEFRERFSALLERRGIPSARAGTVAEALEALRAERCGCVVLDVCVGDCPWVEGLKRIRRVAHDLPIVITAKETSKETEAHARLLGVSFYHVKTFSEEELLDAVEEAVAMTEKEKRKTGKQAKILTIDDDPDLQDAMKTILEGAGYRVVQAFGKEEGKAKLAAESPDLVILDIMMETMTAGFQFLYETVGGKAKGKPHVPILAMTSISAETGYSFSPGKDEDFFPADDYLAKPVEPKKLLERVAALLEGKAKAKE